VWILARTLAWALTLAQATLQSQKHGHYTKPQTFILYKANNINPSQSHKHQQFIEPKTSTLYKAKTINPLQSQKNHHFSEPRESTLH
jgi:hypothetical protein